MFLYLPPKTSVPATALRLAYRALPIWVYTETDSVEEKNKKYDGVSIANYSHKNAMNFYNPYLLVNDILGEAKGTRA